MIPRPFRLMLLVVLTSLRATPPELLDKLGGLVTLKDADYVRARDVLVARGPALLPDLLPLAVGSQVNWKTQLVERIVYERIAKSASVNELLRHDWKAYPPYAKPGRVLSRYGLNEKGEEVLLEVVPPPPGHVLIPVMGPSALMGDEARKVLREAGLWYYYIELAWKNSNEIPPTMTFDPGFVERWPRWCTDVVKEQPEKIWWARALADRLETSDFKDWRDINLFNDLMASGEGVAVPFLARRFDDYFRADTKGREANPGSRSRSYPARFNRFLPFATSQNVPLLEKVFREQPLLAPLNSGLDEVRVRKARDESERLRFRMEANLVETPPPTR